jgi:hypothetical protein
MSVNQCQNAAVQVPEWELPTAKIIPFDGAMVLSGLAAAGPSFALASRVAIMRLHRHSRRDV